MKTLFVLLAALLASACANVPTTAEQAPSAKTEVVQQYPAWLEMKPGYAEACMSGGGCVPMTQGELNQLASEIVQRTLQACRRAQPI